MSSLMIDDDDVGGTREAILSLLEDGMADLAADIDAASPTSTEEKRIQLRRFHEIGYLANQFRKLSRDTEVDEMHERLELLEGKHEDGGGR